MPRLLSFDYQGQPFRCALRKVDRSRLYGTRDVESLDAEGGRCELATLAADGQTLIPPGGTAIGYLDADGLWLGSDQLTAVDGEGQPLQRVPSSFDQPVVLADTVEVETFLEHSIRLTYALEPPEGEDLAPGFLKALEAGSIFRFPFSYRGGFDTDPAFLLRGEDGTSWLLIGVPNAIQYVTLEQAAACGADLEADDGEAAPAELDFHML